MIIHREQLLGWETQYLEMEGMLVDGALIRRLFPAHVTCKALYNIHHSLNQLQTIIHIPLHIFSSSGNRIHFRISVWNQTEKPRQLPHPSPALLQAGLCTPKYHERGVDESGVGSLGSFRVGSCSRMPLQPLENHSSATQQTFLGSQQAQGSR